MVCASLRPSTSPEILSNSVVFLLKEIDHSVLALSDCTMALFPHSALKNLTETYPHLTRLLWLLTLLDSALHREWIMCLSHLSAAARAAHLFCELACASPL
jgi:CRP-like cAMP-binding protein